MTSEVRRASHDLLPAVPLPGDERLEVPLQVLRDEHLSGFSALSVLDDQGGLPISEKTAFDAEGGDLGGPQAR